MSNFRTANQLLTVEIEATPGVDAEPTIDDAVKIQPANITPNLESFDPNEVTGALDAAGTLPAGGNMAMPFSVVMRGTGTPGIAPEYGKVLRGCAMGQTLTAAAITGTAVAGTASSLTLEDAAGVLRGMVIMTTGGTGPGQIRVISAVDGDTDIVTVVPNWTVTPDATTTYSIPANALYRPISSNVESVSVYRYQHETTGGQSRLMKAVGAAGTFQLTVPVRQPGLLQFNFTGQLTTPVDVAHPGDPTYTDASAPGFMGGRLYLDQAPITVNQLQIDLGGDVQMTDDPWQEYGYGIAGQTNRQAGGRFNPPLARISERNAFESWRDQTVRPLWAAWGAVAGSRVSVFQPQIRFTNIEDEDVRGFAHEGLQYHSVEPNAGVFICLF